MDPIFKCEECGKEFKKKNKFNRHVKETHSDDKPYKCEECGTEFKRNSHLTRHKKLKHSDDPKPFSCNIDNCLQKFATKQHLDRHIKTIHFGDKIKCEECDVFFNKKSLLLKHQTQIHKKQEPFICSVEGCGRGFFREIDLTKHQKVHENKDQGLASLNIKRRRSCLSEGISTEAAFSENFDKASESSNALNLTLQKTKSKELYLCFYEGCLKAFSRVKSLFVLDLFM